jgi:signal transduction histidine kinase
MSEVSCRSFFLLIEAVRDRGLSERELLRGLPYTVDALARPSNRIPWNDYVVLLENGAHLLGGPESLETLATRYFQRAGGMLGAVASRVLSARPLYHMGARWYGPAFFSSTSARCEDLGDGRIQQTIEILPGYRDSELFFHVMRGALRGVPALLGQPLASVEMGIMPRCGVFTIAPPPHLSAPGRIRRALSWRRALERADQELEVERDELRGGYALTRMTSQQLEALSRAVAEERREHRRAEEMLRRAQRLETMGQLAGRGAHDFNNILTTITGCAELALERIGRDDPIATELEEIRAASERGATLVRQILGLSRPRASVPDSLELNSVIEGMESMLTRLVPESIELVVYPSPEPIPVVVDPGQFEQIVVNLVVNSRDAMPGGGRITIEISRAPPSEVEPALSAGTQAVRYGRVEVRDTGCGMDSRTLSRAFEPFFSTKARGKGTGLGLAIVHGIVSQSGGVIRLESEVGNGTEVTIDLPARTSTP